jgi:uncharacterized protein (DUF1330 family)
MPAYVIVEIEVLDEEAYSDYRRRAPAVVRQFGGRYLARGEAEALEGPPSLRTVILEFVDVETVRRWHTAEEYRELRELRQRATRSRLRVVAGVTAQPWGAV